MSGIAAHTANSGNSTTARVKSVQVDCPAGKVATGGGGEVSPTDTTLVFLTVSIPRANGWFVKAESAATGTSWRLIAHVVCAASG